MQELVWFLLPVAAASGWWLARREARGVRVRASGAVRQEYFRGLNFLLNEQPDKAIEVFVKILEVDSDTVDTHLALGNLFRRRGEVDRAIRIHQNLIARPTLEQEQRSQALLELGKDYLRAGLFDRAEKVFLELVRVREFAEQARRSLLDIYQQEKEWENAIQTARQLADISDSQRTALIGQFCCELAEEARHEGSRDRARQLARRALAADSRCVRANLLLGDIEREAGDCRAAVKAYRRVFEQDRDYVAEIIEPLRECCVELDDRDGYVAYLREVLREYQGTSVVLALAEEIRHDDGAAAASRFVVEQLKQRPSVRGLEWLIDVNMADAEGQGRENLLVLRQITGELLRKGAAYKCVRCGFAAKGMHWRCPSCKEWSSFRQIHGVEGE